MTLNDAALQQLLDKQQIRELLLRHLSIPTQLANLVTNCRHQSAIR